MRIAEPTTTLTDVALGVCTGLMAGRLLLATRACGEPWAWAWVGAFVASAAAALLGAASHGLVAYLGRRERAVVWLGSLMGMVLAATGLAAATAGSILPPQSRHLVVTALGLYSGVAQLAVWRTGRFGHAAAWCGVPMVVAFVLAGAGALADRAGAAAVAGGIALGFAAVAVQRSGVDVHPRFGHNDIYHVVQLAALWILHLGALALVGR